MNTIVNKEYLKYYENTKEIEITKYIIQQLMITLMERLKRNHWLSTETIQMALKKCENMLQKIFTFIIQAPTSRQDKEADEAIGSLVTFVNALCLNYKKLTKSLRYFWGDFFVSSYNFVDCLRIQSYKYE
jgi:predicted metalloendopeptidase